MSSADTDHLLNDNDNVSNYGGNLEERYFTRADEGETGTVMATKPGTQGIAPPLSEGKKYHAFFSYEISDRDWVKEVVQRLESPELGFRCSIHERDFHAGKRIIENITEHIRVSEKTVLVLSPDFIQSHWCRFEIELGMVLSMEESQLLVVPVMVKQCDAPDTIKTLTYIDATTGNDWWQRFVETVTAQDTLMSTFSGARDLTIQPRYENMDFLSKLSSVFRCSSGSDIKTPYVPEALIRPGVQVSVEDFDQAMDIIRTSSACPCKCLCDSTGCCVAVFLVLLIFSIVAAFTLIVSEMNSKDCYENTNGTLECNNPHIDAYITTTFFSLLMPSVAMAVVYVMQRTVRISRMMTSVQHVNRILLERNVLTGVTVERGITMLFKVVVKFWFYNITECQKHLTLYLQQKFEDYDQSRQDMLQARATRLLYRHSGEYTTAYMDGKLRPKHGIRHVRNASCLCQFIEEIYSDKTNIPDF